jgi:hypothetical protein
MSEDTYTLRQAQIELARRECRAHGHDFDVLRTLGKDGPTHVICGRCGRRWPVGEGSGG